MPVLPLEPYVFPDDLLTNPARCLYESARWWVLHTRPRSEKALARAFLDRGVSFFLPLYLRQWSSRGRLLSSYNPLFPSYIFLHGERAARLQAFETKRVVRILEVEDQPQLQTDLERTARLIASGAPLTPEERLKPGKWVEITSGPLAGMAGKILRRGKQWKFLVEVRFLQRGVTVEVEAWMIQAASSQRQAAAGAKG